jgi:hypothetical protein
LENGNIFLVSIAQQLHFKDKGGVRRDLIASSLCTIAIFRLDIEDGLHKKKCKKKTKNKRKEQKISLSTISPTFMVATPRSHPLMTAPAPSLNEKGSPRFLLESNSEPSVCRVPT